MMKRVIEKDEQKRIGKEHEDYLSETFTGKA